MSNARAMTRVVILFPVTKWTTAYKTALTWFLTEIYRSWGGYTRTPRKAAAYKGVWKSDRGHRIEDKHSLIFVDIPSKKAKEAWPDWFHEKKTQLLEDVLSEEDDLWVTAFPLEQIEFPHWIGEGDARRLVKAPPTEIDEKPLIQTETV